MTDERWTPTPPRSRTRRTTIAMLIGAVLLSACSVTLGRATDSPSSASSPAAVAASVPDESSSSNATGADSATKRPA